MKVICDTCGDVAEASSLMVWAIRKGHQLFCGRGEPFCSGKVSVVKEGP